MANDLVPMPGKRPAGNGRAGANGGSQSGGGPHTPDEGKVWDPVVAAGFVDTDAQTAGFQWDLPPEDKPWEGYEAARVARRDAERAERDAEWARRHGLAGYAVLRASDAADNRQHGWDWGDARTWAIIFAMFFGFLLFSAFVYYLPQQRHDQIDGPTPVPPIRVYLTLKELPGL